MRCFQLSMLPVRSAIPTMLAIGLALVMTATLAFGTSIRAGIEPSFDQRIALDSQHSLVIHYGSYPTCAYIPNPPQHDCFWPGWERREFSIEYLSPNGVRSLLAFQLPES